MKFIKPILMAVLAASAMAAHAKYNGEDRGRPVMPSVTNAKMQAECSGCHMAYPPGLLPAASWKKIMGGLDKHFGTDASLSAADNKEITDYLVKYESNRWTSNAAPLRITDGEWFKAKHMGGEINASVWKRESVKSPGNCSACHQGAEKGDFNEHNIRIPK
ncbi:MAG: diheme cytochrome c [Comamonadaceae bacterium]|nr:MAG: diheme cytochrome c [Comamonadaceae bacterium]